MLNYFFVDGKHKTLDTGAVPTENLPMRSHKAKAPTKCRVDEFTRHLKEIPLDPWAVTALNDTEIRIELCNREHSIPKYTLIIDSCLHFSLHVYNWLLPDQHKIYTSCRRRINSGGILELLQCLSNNEYKICEGLRENDYLNSKDPIAPSHSSYSVSDVIRHIVQKNIGMETNFRVMVILHAVDCMILFDQDVCMEQIICETCLRLQKKIYQHQARKERTSNALQKIKLHWLHVVLRSCEQR